MGRLRLFAVWLVVLVLTTTVTWQIVNAAESQISDRGTPALSVETTTTSSSSTTSPDATTGATTPGASTSTTVATTSVTSSPTSTSTSEETSSTLSTASTTTTEAPWMIRSIESQGGNVVVRYRPGEVELQAATPAPGFVVEIDDPGPPEVRVEFESEEDEYRVEVSWDDGLDIEISGP